MLNNPPRDVEMELSAKIVIASVIVILVVVIFGAYFFLNNALAPLEEKQVNSTSIATKYVQIQASTFNGNIEIQPSISSEIEVIYNIQAPAGHLTEISAATTNKTLGEITEVGVDAKIDDSSVQIRVNYRADITIKVPNTSQYNLTLKTLNGNIIKPQLDDTNIVAQTSNGYIDIYDDNATSIDASSDNGNVKISLAQGTLFQVDATTGNGHVTYQGIAMNTNIQTSTHLNGATTDGTGKLEMTLSSANGNVEIVYLAK
jgi:DUF4097 and DUF4098 domain-containing protein YvlB